MLLSSPHINAFLFERYEAKAFRSDSLKHKKKRKTPEGIYTCWDINTSTTAWDDRVPCCAPCGRFKAEKALKPCLSKLTSNREASSAYHCDTLWKHSDTPNVTNYLSTQSSERQAKRRTVSPMSSPQETPPAINRPSLPTPGPVKKRKAKSALELELQQVCDDLTDRLRFSDEDKNY